MAVLVGVLALVAVLASCSPPSADDPAGRSGATVEGILAKYGLDGLAAEEIIDRLDRVSVADRPTDLVASVRPHQVVLAGDVADETGEMALPLPEGRSYVAVAPYLNRTHACHFHSPTTCLGELRNTTVEVTVVDETTGKVLLDRKQSTFDNGFLGLWLPRGIDARLRIDHAGRTATAAVSTTRNEDPTCLTTLRLT